MTFLPRPLQRPRIPIWVGGTWPRRAPLRRALRWDGAVVTYQDDTPTGPRWRSASPDDIAELASLAHRERGSLEGFDIVVGGRSADENAHLVEPLAAAGATWWQESLGPHHGSWDETVLRIGAGPPPGHSVL